MVVGPAMTHRIWRTPTHALILGPAADNGPYGYLTHLQLSCTPLGGAPELPPAVDGDALTEWITAHVDWCPPADCWLLGCIPYDYHRHRALRPVRCA